MGVRNFRRQFVLVNEFLRGENHFEAAQTLVGIVGRVGRDEMIHADLQESEFKVSRPTVTVGLGRFVHSTNLKIPMQSIV